jgi:uncharacterized protein YbjT (DUF2867 family)
MRVAVAGGTGLLGRLVVAELTERGDEAVVLARSVGVDLSTGSGVGAALAGCDAVVDVTNTSTLRRAAAVAFFDAVSRHLLAGARDAGVGHVVAVSIVGVDTVDFGYYLGKRRQEELLAAGPVPWTLLRATQFHEFAGQLVARAGVNPFVVVPAMLSRPVAAREVAARLVDLVHGRPQGVTPPLAGPQTLRMVDMVRRYLAATARRGVAVPVRMPGRAGAAMATGRLIPAAPFHSGTVTFEAYLSALPARVDR